MTDLALAERARLAAPESAIAAPPRGRTTARPAATKAGGGLRPSRIVLQRKCEPCEAAERPAGALEDEPRTKRPSLVQAKLVVGQSDDPLERDADAVAEQATAMSRAGDAEPRVPRQAADDAAAAAGGGGGQRGEAPPIVRQVLSSPGRPLEPATRAYFEPRLGVELSAVRVHADDVAARSARSVGAAGYTVGEHMAFGAGRYAPGTADGRRLIAHEFAHVVQQGGARRGTPAGVVRRDGDPNPDQLRKEIQAIPEGEIRGKWAARKADFLTVASDSANTLSGHQMYQIFLRYWMDRVSEAYPEAKRLEDEVRKPDPSAFMDKKAKFDAGKRGVFPADYEAATDRLAAANYYSSYLIGVHDWLDIVDNMGKHVTLNQVNEKTVELIKGRELRMTILGFVIALASLPPKSPLPSRAPAPPPEETPPGGKSGETPPAAKAPDKPPESAPAPKAPDSPPQTPPAGKAPDTTPQTPPSQKPQTPQTPQTPPAGKAPDTTPQTPPSQKPQTPQTPAPGSGYATSVGELKEGAALKTVPGARSTPPKFPAYDGWTGGTVTETTQTTKSGTTVVQSVKDATWINIVSPEAATADAVKGAVTTKLRMSWNAEQNPTGRSPTDPAPVAGNVKYKVVKDGPAKAVKILVNVPGPVNPQQLSTLQKAANDAVAGSKYAPDLPNLSVEVISVQ